MNETQRHSWTTWFIILFVCAHLTLHYCHQVVSVIARIILSKYSVRSTDRTSAILLCDNTFHGELAAGTEAFTGNKRHGGSFLGGVELD